MEDKTVQQSGALALICPTCGARYTLPKYVEGQKYGCKRCSASLMFGKFALQQELGRGGFGIVYKAFQADLQRVVALKFLHSDSEESTERFMREARIAANLSHPNIIAIFEVGQHDGKPYITMQYIDGITTNKASFSIREAVFVMRDAAIAVDYAHARDVIHRDIKPHNIMVTQERSGTSAGETTRRTFVMDFGLARSANKGGTLTTEGQVMGTPAFMSPEQAEGKPCDLRSDVYSLGATLFSLVTKRPPFEAPTPLQILMQVTQEDPPAPSAINPEIDKGLEAIILKAMSKDPAHRYPTASRFAQDLTSWLAGGVTDAGPTVHLSVTPGALKAARRKKSGAMVALGALLILAGGGGLAWKILGKPNPDSSRTITQNPPAPGPSDPIPAPPPASATVLLEIVTDPPDAVVRIDNSAREYRSPVSLNDGQIAPGLHEIVISKHGYQIVKEPVTVTPGGTITKVSKTLLLEARKVAFVLESTPTGARILLNDRDIGATTPHTVYHNDVDGVSAKVVLELDGYVTQQRQFDPTGKTQRVPLPAKTGTFVVTSAAAGASLHLFVLPASLKNAKAVAGLWSDNPDQLVQAVNALDDADVPHVIDRLKVLKAKADPRIRDRVASLAARAPSPTALKPEKSVSADDRGVARLDNAWVLSRYRIFATSPRTLDYLSGELTPRQGAEDNVTVESVLLATVSVKSVRPPAGKFRLLLADQSEAGVLNSGSGTPVRVASGSLQLQFIPPANDPLLRDFTVPITVKDQFDLGGNLYQYAGEAHQNAGNALPAVRCYAKVLEEKTFPPSEQAERAKLPELIRRLYRGWIDEAVGKGKSLGGDLAARLEAEKGKSSEAAFLALVELYAAADATPALRGGAAAELATLLGKQKQAYEALEWAERCVKEKFDPGRDAVTLLSVLVKGYPGLQERWDPVASAIEAARKASEVKADPPTPPSPSEGVRVGTLQVTKFGTFVKLDPGMQVSKDDILDLYREGGRVGEVIVLSIHVPDEKYPNGYATCKKGTGTASKDDEVRRKK
ncbi:MAG TPA: serine/threonine-protein kinase [Planctomycetota bacterium]|nr:serine/threonine-protein kinase [Planctomycetota bacterium]